MVSARDIKSYVSFNAWEHLGHLIDSWSNYMSTTYNTHTLGCIILSPKKVIVLAPNPKTPPAVSCASFVGSGSPTLQNTSGKV